METLKFLLQGKKADLQTPREVVHEASEWMRTQLTNAGITFQQAARGSGLGAFSHFQIQSHIGKMSITLHLKVAEINGQAYAFSEVRVTEERETVLFPFFGEISTTDGKTTILHYIADFILSTMPEETES